MVMRIVVLAFSLAVGTAGCAAQHSGNSALSEGSATARAASFITMTHNKPVHCTAADGGHLLAQAGHYGVESADESHVRLTSETSAAPLVIAAVLETHDTIRTNRRYTLQARTEVTRFDDGIVTIDIGSPRLEILARDHGENRIKR